MKQSSNIAKYQIIITSSPTRIIRKTSSTYRKQQKMKQSSNEVSVNIFTGPACEEQKSTRNTVTTK